MSGLMASFENRILGYVCRKLNEHLRGLRSSHAIGEKPCGYVMCCRGVVGFSQKWHLGIEIFVRDLVSTSVYVGVGWCLEEV